MIIKDSWVPAGCVTWMFGVAEPHEGELLLEMEDGLHRHATDSELIGLLLERPGLWGFIETDRRERLKGLAS